MCVKPSEINLVYMSVYTDGLSSAAKYKMMRLCAIVKKKKKSCGMNECIYCHSCETKVNIV